MNIKKFLKNSFVGQTRLVYNDSPTHHSHTLPSRISQRSNQSLAKSVSAQSHDKNDRQTNGRKEHRTDNKGLAQ